MGKYQCNVRLRPTRIAFLLNPNDKASLRKIAQASTTLWGGTYNPIIPIFGKTPEEWRNNPRTKLGPKQIINGYIKYYEPDVFIETKTGQIDKTSVKPLKNHIYGDNVIHIDDLFDREFRGVYEPCVGQYTLDIIEHIYENERKFQLKEETPAIYGKYKNNLIWDIIVGSYPSGPKHKVIKESFENTFKPEMEENKSITKENWLSVFGRECVTPLNLTKYKIDINTSKQDPTLYIFDTESVTDLIDLWNLRSECETFFPIPIRLLEELLPRAKKYILNIFRLNTDSNFRYNCTVQISRSIASNQQLTNTITQELKTLPTGSIFLTTMRYPVWSHEPGKKLLSQRRPLLSSKNTDQELVVNDDNPHTEFEALVPDFSEDISLSKSRWANVLKFRVSAFDSKLSLTLPFNTFDNSWPFDSIDTIQINSEGWVVTENFFTKNKRLSLINQTDAFKSYFEKNGIDFNLSEAGRIGKQALESLGGLAGLNLISDPDLIKFLNKVAASSRKKSSTKDGTVEEQYPERTATKQQWTQAIKKRNERAEFSKYSLQDYVNKKVVKVGLETICTNCYAKNWHDLDEISYEIKCVRCLEKYSFPQGDVTSNNGAWKYRVIGAFAVPDYAQGAYGALLAIRFFASLQIPDSTPTYSTAAELTHKGKIYEVDFLLWSDEESTFWENTNPALIIGEAKSFASSAVTEKDIQQIKKAAELSPGCVISISVLKSDFSEAEKDRLRGLLNWTRQSVNGGPKYWLIVLTGTELFSNYLSITWKKKGGMHEKLAAGASTRKLSELSDATVQLYLNEPT